MLINEDYLNKQGVVALPTRKIGDNGKSLIVTVPSKFVKRTGVKRGDRVDVTIDFTEGTIIYHFPTAVKQMALIE